MIFAGLRVLDYDSFRLSAPIPTSEGELMRITNMLIVLLVLALAVSVTPPAFAQDGAATYKTKCAGCHGPEGQGKVGPALKGTSLNQARIADLLTKGDDAKKAPHKKGLSSLSADDATAVAAFVKTLQ
jgi:mono/diheme cytochrome c family protein